MLGVQDSYEGPNRWQVSTAWRYQRSDRHFRGIHEEPNRQAEGSEVINDVNLLDVGIRYNASNRLSFTLGIPYLMATRSSPIRDANRVVVDRSITQARGLGDVTLVARRLLFDPTDHVDGNVMVGFGVKLPTGQNNVVDARQRLVNGQRVTTIETVDQSIQPGDGGFGVILEAQAYHRIAHSGFVGYFSGTYLLNPENESGVPTFRTGLGEEVMSIADVYVARLGATYSSAAWGGWAASFGGRIEGVPVEDLIGSSTGFRRPGYAVSAEPSVSYSRNAYTFSLSVPFALHRNRQRSVPDRLEPGRIGDAAFADYVVLFGISRKF